MGLRVAATAPAAAGVRVLGGGAASVTPRPWVALGGRRRLSVRMSVATTETTTSATAAVGAVSLLSRLQFF